MYLDAKLFRLEQFVLQKRYYFSNDEKRNLDKKGPEITNLHAFHK